MRPKTGWVVALLWAGLGGTAALALKPLAQKSVTVTVVDAHVEPAVPVAALTVSLTYLDGSTNITDTRDVTNPRGQAFLQVSADTAQRDDLRIVIRGSPTLVIFEPADGQLHGVGSTVQVKLLPKGSAALAGPVQIEALQRRLSQRVITLQSQNLRQQGEINSMKAQAEAQKQAVEAGLEEWAKAVGLDVQVAQQKVLEWAQATQAEPGVSTERRALAAFALKNYGQAADLFGEATDEEMASLHELKKRQQEQNRTALQKILEMTERQAKALQLAGRYPDATAVWTKTLRYIVGQQKQSQFDGGLLNILLQAISARAYTRWEEATVSSPADSARLLSLSVDDEQGLVGAYGKIGDRRGWARAQMDLGNALGDEGERASGDKSAALLEQAVNAFHRVLEVFTEADFPQEWAQTETSLAITLVDEGKRSEGDKVGAFFDQALQAHSRALEVFTKSDFPEQWAAIQMNLGVALAEEGTTSASDRADGLFNQAAQAFQRALEVDKKAELPQDWARIQMNLGNLLIQEGRRAHGDQAAIIFGKAMEAYQRALEVFTKADFPQVWAMTQMNLGIAFSSEGERSDGETAAALFTDAVEAYQRALEVYTKGGLPQDWARTETNLGVTLANEGQRASGAEAAKLFDQAVQAYQLALEVFTKAEVPQDWAMTQMDLGIALSNEGQRAASENSAELFDQALKAYQRALEIFTKTDLPQDWALVMRNIAGIYHLQGKDEAAQKAWAEAQAVDPQ